ncbi:2-succinyl-5-enolpyruvyl-6-hydroxy-3-cyclohexene-1-carboxylic-acid synthase [Halalkalicoccus jeotgali]|uniref:2-succinyl-5-enolpyruvyl-6-hydroxy-3-cyclohexene-1-carboxylate synthase n=1 Tax=Halalkalicoccus jeotgali (strain DSM 18796 / CECT 7217 / JCM 14584 / KCTC 4019 / B3) TaxID=795797 RepID=D8J2U7_HALJB|nr:2-succinyl-5-enolpyruvyl-6-hydroxy-3-cyclohexene-1-carboxylic-acid synthase [Halalkalicoccus jeotgali]ADJ15054.1 2-succinyl-5-enolpyruvyl-6-hydroxy-3-cyclohexene-1-carboxylate synthase [Halalkalicoccus jeotgali B3]ELY34928.1 2-succinyl-6-hydroxy-2,4-cyclohexadiene-1-carboxylate synthase [Halalkalicoccus jeotgali B3]
MSAPNRATLWGRTVVDELVASGIEDVCLAPGSRSTPLTVAFSTHDSITVHSHLDERSAAFYALGRAKRTGEPTPLVCTSGTAAANFHPAVIEASQSRVPMLLLTADRPAELRDSGANQTIDQTKLYGEAVRSYRELPEPAPEGRRLRSLRTTVCRALAESTGTPAGPVHINAPFAKPLEPTETDDVPADFPRRRPTAVEGREGPFVSVTPGRPAIAPRDRRTLVEAIDGADRGLIVAGPSDSLDGGAIRRLARAAGFPLLADPLSGARFGTAGTDGATVIGGYDSWLASVEWPDPDLVVRFGASPTSKTLRNYLRDGEARQIVVDPAGEWREATFTATDLVVADGTDLASALAADLDSPEPGTWRERFAEAETRYWKAIAEETGELFEGAVLERVFSGAPDPATVFVSNSMPIRDTDRFARPRDAELTVLGNRGASGIDGITSSALGAGSATDDPLVLVTGDLAYYHDTNGLLALSRCGVDATIVLINNDGGGIFHMLPIEAFDPPFTDQFETPHGLDFAPTGELYGFEFVRTDSLSGFEAAYDASLSSSGTQVIEVRTDGEASHRRREAIHERVGERLG